MNILGIDPGRKWGWCTTVKGEHGDLKLKGLLELKEIVLDMIGNYGIEAVIGCRPFGRHQAVIRLHSAMLAIVELVCEEKGIQYMEFADSKMRKEVTGKGRMSKDEVMEFTGIDNEHAADARMAVLYAEILQRKYS